MTARTDGLPPRGRVSEVSGLLRKDLAVFIPRDRFLIGLVYLLGHPTVLPSQEAFFWLGMALSGALAMYVPIIEWHQETDRMLSSLPVRRTSLVLTRYLSSILWFVFGGLAWATSGRILGPVLAKGLEPHMMWTTFEGITTFFLMAGVLITLFLPLYFRFGMGRGLLAFSGLSLGFYGLVSIPSGLFLPAGAIESRVAALTQGVGPGWALAILLVGMGVGMASSGWLSARWFGKRDL